MIGASILIYMGIVSEHPLVPGYVQLFLFVITLLCLCMLLRNFWLSKYKLHFGIILILIGLIVVCVVNF